MILTGDEITKNVRKGGINISPFHDQHVTTNSYDLTLGKSFIRYKDGQILDPYVQPEYDVLEIPKDGLVLQKGDFILASSHETVGSDNYVPIVHAKSGTARMGLFVHVTADLIDIGSHGNITFQLYATLPVKIYEGMLLAQASFWKPKGEIILYDGKYQGSKGPQASKVYMDMRRKNERTEEAA